MKKPTHRLKILNKTTDKMNVAAGAGWENKDGSISLVLAPGVILTDNTELIYTLFLIDTNREGENKTVANKTNKG